MTLAERISEARGLCCDIEKNLALVEELRLKTSVGPEEVAATLCNVHYILLHELRCHVAELHEHYERRCAGGSMIGRPRRPVLPAPMLNPGGER